MKIKEDIMKRFEQGETIYEIAKVYGTTPDQILIILGLEEPLH